MRRLGFAVPALACLALVSASGVALADGGLLPDEPLSGGTASVPDLAMAPNGYAVAAWDELLPGRQHAVSVATRPPGGAWSRPQMLGANANYKLQIGVAVDAAGDVAVAWEEVVTPNALSFVASRAAGGAFVGPEQLVDAASVSNPAVGIDAGGRVTLLYGVYPAIVARDFQAGSSALAVSPQTVDSGRPSACYGTGPLAVAPSGDAVAGYDCNGAVFALRRAGAWNVTPTIANDQHACPGVSTFNNVSAVGIDGQGHAAGALMTRVIDTTMAPDPTLCTIYFTEAASVRLVLPFAGFMTPLVAPAASGAGTLGSSAPLGFPQLGISPSGLVLAWPALDGTSYRLRVRDFALDGTPGAEQTVDPGESAIAPQLAVGADGRALLAWFRRPATFGAPLPLEAASRPPGGSFGAPLELTPDGSRSGLLATVLDATGSGAIAYVNDTPPTPLHVRGFDAAAPALGGVAIPGSASPGVPVAFAVSPFDVWGPATTSWSFGDGASASGAAVQHAYARAGAFTATVTATDALGNAASKSGTVQVAAASGGSAVAPRLTQASLTHRTFRVGRRRTPLRGRAQASARRRASTVPVGTTFRFTLDRPANVRIGFARQTNGLRGRGGSCLRPSRRLRGHRRCKLFVPDGTLVRSAPQGAISIPFSGRVGRRALVPGRYRAGLTAARAGRSAKPTVLTFRIVR